MGDKEAARNVGPVVRFLRTYPILAGKLQTAALLLSALAGILGTHFEIWKTDPSRSWDDWLLQWLYVTAAASLATALTIARERIEKTESEELVEAKGTIAGLNLQLAGWVKI